MKTLLYMVLSALLIVNDLSSQQIILDSPVKAGELTLFPEMDNPNNYYYLSDKPKIATGANGKPQFSFLRYIENTKTATSTTTGSKSEGEGGGIVHAVISLDVTPAQVATAEQGLKSLNSAGKIQGPIIYTGGMIALISSIAQPNGEFTKTVLGLGKAPILDGQKASVSVLLNKQGAKILRETFNTPTPDMSISFEMSVSGFRKPKKAIIEANFDQIYEHRAFQAAVAAPVLQAEINMAFTDLVKSGAIKVINKGADEQMEKLIEDAYTKLTRMMFESTGGSGTPSLEQLIATAGNKPSMLDRASGLLNSARAEQRAENQTIRAENETRRNSNISTADPEFQPPTPEAENESTSVSPPPQTSNTPRPPLQKGKVGPSEHAKDHIKKNPLPPPSRFNDATPTRQEQALPSIAIAASFEMRKVRQQGMYRIDLEKWSKDNLTMRFDENFGTINCSECFKDVNLEGPYRQREITTFLDGSDAQDFGKYINFVNVLIKKKHESGELTQDELRIDKNNFNAEGNNFSMVYGWKNDKNTQKWAEYEYKTVWNFFGGGLIDAPWQKSNINTIPLVAPFIRSEILIESDPDIMLQKGIRMAEIKLFFKIGDKDQSKQVRLNMKQNQFSTSADIYLSRSNSEFEYEITWFTNDGKSKTSGRQKNNNSIIFINNIPD